jgi:hypothetical protein
MASLVADAADQLGVRSLTVRDRIGVPMYSSPHRRPRAIALSGRCQKFIRAGTEGSWASQKAEADCIPLAGLCGRRAPSLLRLRERQHRILAPGGIMNGDAAVAHAA